MLSVCAIAGSFVYLEAYLFQFCQKDVIINGFIYFFDFYFDPKYILMKEDFVVAEENDYLLSLHIDPFHSWIQNIECSMDRFSSKVTFRYFVFSFRASI